MQATLTTTSRRDACETLCGRDLPSIRDLTREELLGLTGLAADVKRHPDRYAGAHEPAADVLVWARRHEAANGVACRVSASPEEAVTDADVVYTDTWISMGQDAEAEERRRAFAGFTVTQDLLDRASPDVVFMHCLPAHRGEEVAANAIDSSRSIVFRQAENRLHTEKALLLALLPHPRSRDGWEGCVRRAAHHVDRDWRQLAHPGR